MVLNIPIENNSSHVVASNEFYLYMQKLFHCEVNMSDQYSMNFDFGELSQPTIVDLMNDYKTKLEDAFINYNSDKKFYDVADEDISHSGFIIDKKSLNDCVSSIKERTDNGMEIENFISEIYTDIFDENKYSHTCRELSVAHYLHADFLCKNSKYELALANICKAYMHLGEYQGATSLASFYETSRPDSMSIKNSAKKGGDNKKARYKPMKDELIKLIKNGKPKTGWQDENEFIKVMGSKIKEWNASHGKIVMESNLLITVKKWLKSDGMVKDAFMENKLTSPTPDEFANK